MTKYCWTFKYLFMSYSPRGRRRAVQTTGPTFYKILSKKYPNSPKYLYHFWIHPEKYIRINTNMPGSPLVFPEIAKEFFKHFWKKTTTLYCMAKLMVAYWALKSTFKINKYWIPITITWKFATMGYAPTYQSFCVVISDFLDRLLIYIWSMVAC